MRSRVPPQGHASAFLLSALFVICSATPLWPQPTEQMRVYVMRTDDAASDQAVVGALQQRGHKADLGVRASLLASAQVRLSDYHAVIARGTDRERIPTPVVNMLQRYVERSGGLITDGPMFYYLGEPAAVTLRLPGSYCGWLRHNSSVTTLEPVEPRDSIAHNGVGGAFDVTLTAVEGINELCLTARGGAKTFFTSRSATDRNARPGVLAAELSPQSRAVSLSLGLRAAELRNDDFRRVFVNSVEWAAALSQPTPPDPFSRNPISRRVYVMRTDDPASDQEVVSALTERGHQVSLGVRATHLTAAQVRLSDYHAVVARGSDRERMSPAIIAMLQQYAERAGGLITDGPMQYYLGEAAAITLRLPAAYCGWLRHEPGSTLLERVDPEDAVVHEGIAPSFRVDLTQVEGINELCLGPAENGKVLLYSTAPDGARPRPGVLVNEPTPGSRRVAFSLGLRTRELREPNLRRLFVNSLEWATASADATEPVEMSGTSEPLRVYVVRSEDPASDEAVATALQQRGHQVTLGVQAAQLTSAQLSSNPHVVVAVGADRQQLPPAVTSTLLSYLDGGGRLVADGMMMYRLGNANATTLRLPAQYCGWYRHEQANATFDRVDPADAVLHKGVAPTFRADLTVVDGINEICLTPAEAGRILMFSRAPDGTRSRPGVLVNEPGPNTRTLVFSTNVRRRELSGPDFRALFVNAVERVGGRIEPLPLMRPSPAQFSFLFNSSADSPRSQTLQVTPTTLSQVNFTTTVTTESGGDWLRVVPSNGTTPLNLAVQVVPTFLPPGVFTGAIVLSAPGSSSVRIPVTATVNATAPCQYRISSGNTTFAAAGGAGRIGISVAPGCTWTAASSVPWISITSATSGSGPGTVEFSAAATTTAAARSGSLTVAGQSLAVSQAGTTLSFRLEPGAIEVRATEGTTQIEPRVLSVLSTTSAPFTATASGGNWLSVSPASGTASGSISVAINSAGLSAGTHRGSIAVRLAGATPAEQSVPVTLEIESTGAPQLSVEPSTVTLSAIRGGETRTERLLVANKGSGTLSFQASVSGASWLSVSPESGSVSAGAGPASVVLTGDPRGLESGSYSGRVTITTTSGQETSVNVVMTVTAVRQSILLSQSGLTYTAVAQGGTVPPQTFGVLNIGEGVMDWTAIPSTLSGGSWLSLSRTQGRADASVVDIPLIDVGVNGAGLRPGEYHGRITIASPTASNSPQIVSVILQVLPPGSDPGPLVRPTGLIFVTPAGEAPPAQEVSVSNLTGEAREFNSSRLTSDNTLWFTHTPSQAGVPSNQPAKIRVNSSSAGLTPGVKRGVLTLLFTSGAVQHVNILNIVPPQASASSDKDRSAASCPSPRLVLTHTTMVQGFSVAVGQGVPIEIKAADTCGNLLVPKAGAAVSVAVAFSNGDGRLNLVHVGSGVWSGTWRPVRPANNVLMTVTAFHVEGSSLQADQIDLSGSVRDIGRAPIITAGGLVHGASFSAGVPLAPGTLITMHGSNLADEAVSAGRSPLPRELNGSEVLLGDRPLPLLFVSKDQVNVQVPFGVPANTQHQIVVRRGQELSVPETITVTEAMPGIFTKSQDGSGQGSIVRVQTGGLAEPGSPAAAGEAIIIYCTGLGEASVPVESGVPITGETPVPAAVTLTIGGQQAQLSFVGLAPNAVGLYQINAVVPEGIAPADDVSVTVTAGGQTSRAVTMAVR